MKRLALMAMAMLMTITMSAQTSKTCNKKCDMNEKKCEKECCQKTRSASFLYEKDLKWEDAEPGVQRQIMGYDGHYHTQATYVASGKFELTIDGETKILSAGDGYYVAPDVLHGAKCLEAGVLIDTFSPMRADFLGKK